MTLEYLDDITVVWEFSTCGMSQACTTRITKALQLQGNLAF